MKICSDLHLLDGPTWWTDVAKTRLLGFNKVGESIFIQYSELEKKHEIQDLHLNLKILKQ